MRCTLLVRGLAGLSAFTLALSAVGPAFAQSQASSLHTSSGTPVVTETIQVTATRTPEDVETVPASVTVISGEDIANRGARDLSSALALAPGVIIASGGENGPAGSVPEIWGLREFDAFLLVVDGVPWGGAFNPALPSLDLTNVDRIEILRGAAPVMFGATSFVGVIQVIHRAAGAAGRTASVWGGNFGSGGAAASTPLPQIGNFRQSLTVDGERQGFKDDRTRFDRGHVLYRSSLDTAAGSFRFDVDGSIVNQKPASPNPIQDPSLALLTPLDSNLNPSDAKIDENRLHFVTGYDRKLAGGSWSTTLAVTHTTKKSIRGFLSDVSEADLNAEGFQQDLTTDDVYFDSHVAWTLGRYHLVAGVDHLYGEAKADSQSFAYFVPLNGHNAPSSKDQPLDHAFNIDDKRNFSGLYLQGEWDTSPRLHFLAGVRLNHTDEKRTAGDRELSFPDPGDEGTDQRTKTRLSGMVGVNWLVWGEDAEGLWLFGNYRNTFKPAALDFGPEAEPDILNPETARSYEVGLKSRLDGGRFEWELTAFHMNFENLVVPRASADGLPELVNAGSEVFKGVELAARWRFVPDLWWQSSLAWHNAKFSSFEEELDGENTKLDGNRLQLSPQSVASAGLTYSPAHGLFGSATLNYTNSRFLDEQNEILAPAFFTWAAGLGYRAGHYELRLDGFNLNNNRPPISLSELGDGQYYLLPARTLRAMVSTRF